MLSCEPPAVIVQQSTNNQNTSGGTTWIHPMTKQESVTSFLSNNSEGFHSASPSSSSRDSNPHSPRSVDSNREGSPTFYDNRIQPNYSTPYHHQAINMGFNPLTPPAAELQRSPITNTIHSTPMAAPKSPQETGEADYEHYYDSNAKNEKSDDGDSAAEDMDGEDEPGLRIPAVNSHGKMKTFKCKQCEFVAVTKLEFWEHSKEHIKPEKMLTCPKCPFVTEYKHHLEYHMRNHFGSKPFQCNQCSYSCVNKSMLNSHLKSHSNIYQYRCSDCSYATKYCHSLKLHLRKYQHNPAMVLNQDGSPNPFPIIDVYGTRRGPKQKTQLKIQEEVHQHSNHSIFQTPYFPYPPLLSHSLLFQDAKEQSLLQQRLIYGEKIPYSYNPPQSNPVPAPILPKPLLSPPKPKAPAPELEISALDLTNATKVESPSPSSIAAPSTPTTSMKNRRKGRAYKLERCSAITECQEEEDICDDDTLPLARTPSPPPSPSPKLNPIDIIEVTPDIKIPTPGYDCQYCDIVFKDIIMYTMHMGYHGYKDPFTCNMCGVRSADKVSFFIHIARTQHS